MAPECVGVIELERTSQLNALAVLHSSAELGLTGRRRLSQGCLISFPQLADALEAQIY